MVALVLFYAIRKNLPLSESAKIGYSTVVIADRSMVLMSRIMFLGSRNPMVALVLFCMQYVKLSHY